VVVYGGLGLALGDALWVEPKRPVVERITVPLRKLPPELDGFVIAQLSDLHHGSMVGLDEIAHGVELANGLDPDVVVLTGDFVTGTHEYAAPCAEALRGLRARHGVFACLGNHDFWTNPGHVADALEAQGIPVLRNTHTRLSVRGANLCLAAIDDVWVEAHDLESSLQGIPEGGCTVLLCHEPDFADTAAQYPVDLQLSGHTHGGQVRLPLFGPPLLPPFGRKYPQGLRRVGDLTLYTNRGLGRIFPPLRFRCRPEVTALRLVRDGGTRA
jgi:predicted MPP superfamily phosphohydrolase